MNIRQKVSNKNWKLWNCHCLCFNFFFFFFFSWNSDFFCQNLIWNLLFSFFVLQRRSTSGQALSFVIWIPTLSLGAERNWFGIEEFSTDGSSIARFGESNEHIFWRWRRKVVKFYVVFWRKEQIMSTREKCRLK